MGNGSQLESMVSAYFTGLQAEVLNGALKPPNKQQRSAAAALTAVHQAVQAATRCLTPGSRANAPAMHQDAKSPFAGHLKPDERKRKGSNVLQCNVVTPTLPHRVYNRTRAFFWLP
jgi:hypothetical protein